MNLNLTCLEWPEDVVEQYENILGIWEDICRQNSDQNHVLNLYFSVFDCGPLGLLRML